MRLSNQEVLLFWPLEKHILTQGMYSAASVWHGAIDLRCTWDGTTRQPVYAAEDGVVDWTQTWDGHTKTGMQSYGNAVRIRHADYNGSTLQTRYAHLDSVLVAYGQAVSEGQLIGYTGSTGNSTGAHLHFEVIWEGVRRNPLVWLDDSFTVAWDTVYTYGPGETAVEIPASEGPAADGGTALDWSGTVYTITATGRDRDQLRALVEELSLPCIAQG